MTDNRRAASSLPVSRDAIASADCCSCGPSSGVGGLSNALGRNPDAIGSESLGTNSSINRRQA